MLEASLAGVEVEARYEEESCRVLLSEGERRDSSGVRHFVAGENRLCAERQGQDLQGLHQVLGYGQGRVETVQGL